MPTYEELQEQSGLKIGDMVVVTRKVSMHEAGWNNSWEYIMDDMVGNKSIIIDIRSCGILLEDSYSYPYFVLKRVEENKDIPNLKIGSIFTNDEKYLIIEKIINHVYECRIKYFGTESHYTEHYYIDNILKDFKKMDEL